MNVNLKLFAPNKLRATRVCEMPIELQQFCRAAFGE